MIWVRGPNSRRVAGDGGRAVRAWKKGRREGYRKLLWDFLGFFVFVYLFFVFVFSSPTCLSLGEEA